MQNEIAYEVGLDETEMQALYNSFDILLQCSLGEGFALPMIEAQSCGVPVIATFGTGHASLIEKGGIVITEVIPIMFPSPCADLYLPDEHVIADRLYEFYNSSKDRKSVV